jgi:hypothetical protein
LLSLQPKESNRTCSRLYSITNEINRTLLGWERVEQNYSSHVSSQRFGIP